jgi:hypothetical protein
MVREFEQRRMGSKTFCEMRGIVLGRKNWLHLGSREAGPKIAATFSVVESCRTLEVPIRNYLADVLPGLGNRSIQTTAQLTPAACAAARTQQPPRSPAPPSTMYLVGLIY